jgi:hypothetical protein
MDFLGWTKFVLVTHSMKTILRRHHARRCDHAGVRSLQAGFRAIRRRRHNRFFVWDRYSFTTLAG